MTTSFGLSFAAVDILAEGLGVECRVYPFKIPSFGEFAEDRVRIAEAVRDDMRRRGLTDGKALAPEVIDAVRLLSDYQVAVAVLGSVDDDQPIYARAAATARRGMIAVQEGNVLKFELIRPESLARMTASLLPPAKAGPGQSVTITLPSAKPPKPVPDEEIGFQQRVRAPRRSGDAQLRGAEEMLRRPRTGSGHFTVSARDRHGRVTEADTLGWVDTDAGRYLVQVHERDGETLSTFFPADTTRVTHQLNELLKAASQS